MLNTFEWDPKLDFRGMLWWGGGGVVEEQKLFFKE